MPKPTPQKAHSNIACRPGRPRPGRNNVQARQDPWIHLCKVQAGMPTLSPRTHPHPHPFRPSPFRNPPPPPPRSCSRASSLPPSRLPPGPRQPRGPGGPFRHGCLLGLHRENLLSLRLLPPGRPDRPEHPAPVRGARPEDSSSVRTREPGPDTTAGRRDSGSANLAPERREAPGAPDAPRVGFGRAPARPTLGGSRPQEGWPPAAGSRVLIWAVCLDLGGHMSRAR
jgi:hypothetical protein